MILTEGSEAFYIENGWIVGGSEDEVKIFTILLFEFKLIKYFNKMIYKHLLFKIVKIFTIFRFEFKSPKFFVEEMIFRDI